MQHRWWREGTSLYVQTDTCILHAYDSQSPGTRGDVLLLPGAGTPGLCMMQYITPLIIHGFRCIVVDHVGSGRSVSLGDDDDDDNGAGATQSQEMHHFVQNAHALLCTALGSTGRVHIVGYSFGGVVAHHFAERYPLRVRSLSLIATPFSHAKHGIEYPSLSAIGQTMVSSVMWMWSRVCNSFQHTIMNHNGGGQEDCAEDSGVTTTTTTLMDQMYAHLKRQVKGDHVTEMELRTYSWLWVQMTDPRNRHLGGYARQIRAALFVNKGRGSIDDGLVNPNICIAARAPAYAASYPVRIVTFGRDSLVSTKHAELYLQNVPNMRARAHHYHMSDAAHICSMAQGERVVREVLIPAMTAAAAAAL